MMALEEALRFVSCIFRCEPIQAEFLRLPADDSEGLLKLAAQQGFQLSPSELLVVMEWTSRYLKTGDSPMDESLSKLLHNYSAS
jgi:hypothetical protein